VEVRDLHALYPDFAIDVRAEQEALLAADVIVLLFPLHWYSVPGVLKEWIDRVLARGFAYGSGGTQLRGKQLVLSFTVGAPAETYQPEGFNGVTVETLLAPFVATSHVIGTVFMPPIASFGMTYIPGVTDNREQVEERARSHADQLERSLSEHTRQAVGSASALVGEVMRRLNGLADPDAFHDLLHREVVWIALDGVFKGWRGFDGWWTARRAAMTRPIQRHAKHLRVLSLEDDELELMFRVDISGSPARGTTHRWILKRSAGRFVLAQVEIEPL